MDMNPVAKTQEQDPTYTCQNINPVVEMCRSSQVELRFITVKALLPSGDMSITSC